MTITFYGHNTLLIVSNDKKVLVDPFITDNPLSKDKIDIKSIEADYILLTHAHFDHVQDAEAIAKTTKAVIVSNYEIAMYYQKKGIEVHPMNHGGSWDFDFGQVKYVNAVHTSSFEDGTYGGQPGGFVIKGNNKTIYIAGDTALTMDMKLIPMQATLDLAILPIGDNFTMGIDDAIIASDFVACNKVLGVHYDTFGFIKIDPEESKRKFSSKNKELILLDIGDSITV